MPSAVAELQETPLSVTPEKLPSAVFNTLLSEEEAASFLGTTTERVRELTKMQLLPCINGGGECCIRFGDLLAYHRQRETRRTHDRHSPISKLFDKLRQAGVY